MWLLGVLEREYRKDRGKLKGSERRGYVKGEVVCKLGFEGGVW